MTNQNSERDLVNPVKNHILKLDEDSLEEVNPPIRCMLPTEMLEEQPVLVNPRRYERIIKRRLARDKQREEAKEPTEKSYKHESRHKHACNRKRGPDGVFLPKSAKEESAPKKKVKFSRYSAACVLYGMTPDD